MGNLPGPRDGPIQTYFTQIKLSPKANNDLAAIGLGWLDRGFFLPSFSLSVPQSRSACLGSEYQCEFICDAYRYPLVVSNLAIELSTLCAHRFTA